MPTNRKAPREVWMELRSADILKAFMKQKNFSMQRLATYSSCSKSFIGFLANEDKRTCTEALAKRIAEALDVPVEVLFERRTSAVSGSHTKSQRRVA